MAQTAAQVLARARRKSTATVLTERDPAAEVTARDVGLAALAGDRVARAIVRSTGARLGEAMAILVDILSPERIVVGGMAMRLGDLILDPARRVIAREALPPSAAVCQVVPAQLGEQIGDVAALSVAMGI
jgi:glucokinase